ncbi:TPA: hypothetical protein DDW69_01910 [candidate division CPR2 bacterium]|uniref:Glutamine amidotransferase class-I n=1 Tax=candidate division CPR2 bacterium GW2011_GWC1_41_48 TaxID=1618344 RepID=A0A0G0Z9R4_UNCC2|nr:MAG: Glutamine amidotransferase class-I [candidate division CPR2 bacterium GW2011_GWC2_39_35]KKR28517.1 MAG: Glutamine amidotransferase class-I [candidate division CPR2 bacterium GW2011_GWD1_39_7]KKR28700.1 MAG: Glutamine amidotransferase class-I [candidate division CPR2 bacterium GW2011_GWD2_39_7]KKS09778.1 MAG: Glutamine amidotransferase class-I [candidate division CPR2 bacterium GW2011_GWC1_41_48]OGB60983.1 MAG: hypothetical protein A2Y27_03415 [candidate division CPR2 bacterium GWD1_39_7
MVNASKTIGIIDFNPDQNPDRRQYVKRISALLSGNVSGEGIFFREVDDLNKYDALILSGSKLISKHYQEMVRSGQGLEGDYIWIDRAVQEIANFKGPIFGICFGSQILAHIFGGEIGRLDKTEAGYLLHELTDVGLNDPIFGKLGKTFWASHYHINYVKTLPDNPNLASDVLATRNGYIHAFRIKTASGVTHYGTQPHPEMSNPKDAVFLVEVNKERLIEDIGVEECNKALEIPSNASFEFQNVIKEFVKRI